MGENDISLLEETLAHFDVKYGLISRIIKHNHQYGLHSTLNEKEKELIFDINKLGNGNTTLGFVQVLHRKDGETKPPIVHINLFSPSLQIPQRLEIPLRYLLNGFGSLENTYMAYLHALQVNNNQDFVYYGVTKCGWMKRFKEHVRLATSGQSKRQFPLLLGRGIKARYEEIFGMDGT